MKILLLTEAGKDIGMGHISRCSSIYDELTRQDLNVEFLIQSEMDKLELLEGRQYKIKDWQSKEFITETINKEVYCIVDSYSVSASFLQYIEEHAYSCMYIDDMGRINYPAGIVVNPALNTDNIIYPDLGDITYLLGKDYVILRQAFRNSNRKNVADNISDVLITMGGSDIQNITFKLLKEFPGKQIKTQFHVVLGSGYRSKEKLLQDNYSNVTLYENLKETEMQSLMLNCDLAITAAGQTIYELLATRTPFIPIQTAENQKNNMDGLAKHEIIKSKINIKEPDFIRYVEQAYHNLKNVDERKKQVNINVVDGRGTKRIVNHIFRKLYSLRDLEHSDMEALFQLSNQDYVRKHSIQKEKIEWEQHVEWFNKIKESTNDYFYVITNNKNDFLGQVRYKIENDSAVVSISLGEKLVGKGLSDYFLKKSIDLLINENSELSKIIAYISTENIASQRLFKKAGFTYLETKEKMERYEYILTR